MIVTVVRAEGLPGVTSGGVFRRPKTKKTHRRYVRVSMIDKREGRGQVFTEVTSSVDGRGSTCSWGEKGSTGESVSLQVDEDIFDSLQRSSLERATGGTAAFELEIWNEASDGGGEDVLLGRGQVDPAFVDSQPRWVMLDPKGKVEISTATSLREGSGDQQIDENGQKSVSTQDGQTLPLGTDHEQNADSEIAEDTPDNSSPDNVPKPTSPKWGLLRMPDLKDSLNASLGRAAKLRGKQRAQTAGDEPDEEPVATDSPEEGVDQPAEEAEDGGERQVTTANVPPDEQLTPAKQANRAALRGMQSIKESLQARLVGASGKPTASSEHAQNEEEDGAAESQADDKAHDLPSTSREGSLAARGSASSNVAILPDEPARSEANVQQDDSRKQRTSRDEQESGSPIGSGGRAERGRNTHLRSLLRDSSTGDQGERQSEDDKQDDPDRPDEDQTARRDPVDEQTAEPLAKGRIAHVVSALDTISAKAAAASASKFKSTLYSPSLTSTLRGLGWNKAKEDPRAGDLPPPSDSSCEPVQIIPLATPADANETSEPVATEQSGSCDLSTPPSETTTLLVKILRASGLPEILAKSKFGWTKKNATQDPAVRLSMCNVLSWSSVVHGGGRECRWGTKNEGDVVELSIPSSDVPAEGLEALKLVVEVFNRASDDLEHDILLGKAEILVGDWLGKKAKWAALDAKQSQGGRVKLSLALKGSGKEAGGMHRSNDASDDIAGDSSGDATDTEADAAVLATPHPSATSAFPANNGDTAQQTDEVSNQSETEVNDLEALAQHDGEASAHAEGSNAGVPPLALDSVSDGNQQQALEANDSSHIPALTVEKPLEVQRGEERSPSGSMSCSSDSSLSSGATNKKEGKEVGITILVIEADALRTRGPGADGVTPKSDPYAVLHVCGEKRATSAIIEGGASCHWPGAGEEIFFAPSYAALAAAGWGQEEAVGPYLTIEVYNQESQSREADAFIGSANVTLKEYLGSGPKWVDVHRRRKARGRVLIDVKSPILLQDMPIPGQPGHEATIGRDADEEQLQEAAALCERRQSSSSALEDGGPEGDGREETGADRKGVSLSSRGSDHAGNGVITDPPHSTASDGSRTGSLGEIQQKQGRTPSGADIDATSVDTVGSHKRKLSRQQSQASAPLMPDGEKGETEGDTDKSATAEGAGAGLVPNDRNEITPSQARETPDAGASNEETSHGLARRAAGGTATALDLTSATFSSDRQKVSIAEEKSAEMDTVMTTVEPSERFETEHPQSSGQECESPRQVVPVAQEKNGTGRRHSKELHSSSDPPAAGAPMVGTKDKTSTAHPATSHDEAKTEALDAQPREQARTRRVDPQRIERAREIIRRRRSMASKTGHASPGLRVAGRVVGIGTAEKAQAATTIQGAFRGRIARRRLRVCQRSVVKIQAVYRGHIERKEFVALSARSKRARAEELRAQARRSRIALTTQVSFRHAWVGLQRRLFLWRNCPALVLVEVPVSGLRGRQREQG